MWWGKEIRDVLVKALKEAGFEVDAPEAAFYVWIKVPAGYTSAGFCGELLDKVGIVATPGTGFGRSGEGYFRLTLTAPDDRLREAVGRSKLWFGTRDAADRGSNAWAVAADGTPDGSTLLAADGHLALGVPALFFQMGVDVRTFGDDPLRVTGNRFVHDSIVGCRDDQGLTRQKNGIVDRDVQGMDVFLQDGCYRVRDVPRDHGNVCTTA